jgi:hypothetical protein
MPRATAIQVLCALHDDFSFQHQCLFSLHFISFFGYQNLQAVIRNTRRFCGLSFSIGSFIVSGNSPCMGFLAVVAQTIHSEKNLEGGSKRPMPSSDET